MSQKMVLMAGLTRPPESLRRRWWIPTWQSLFARRQALREDAAKHPGPAEGEAVDWAILRRQSWHERHGPDRPAACRPGRSYNGVHFLPWHRNRGCVLRLLRPSVRENRYERGQAQSQ